MRRRAGLFFGTLAAGALVSAASAPTVAAPITTNTALPVAKGSFVWRSQLASRERSGGGLQDPKMRVQAWENALGYGVTGNLAVFGVLPWFIERELKVRTDDGRVRRTADGLGDLELFARYTVLRRDTPGETLRVAPLLGLKAPTGRDDARDALGRLPRPLQTGTGTWDAFAGVIATHQTLDYQLDAQAQYRVHGRHQGFSPGDVARFDVSYQHRLWPRHLQAGLPGFVYGVLESTVEHQRRDLLGGSRVGDSGGTQWLGAVGLQHVSRRWIAEAAVQFPLAQNLRGDAMQDDLVVRAGVRFNF